MKFVVKFLAFYFDAGILFKKLNSKEITPCHLIKCGEKTGNDETNPGTMALSIK